MTDKGSNVRAVPSVVTTPSEPDVVMSPEAFVDQLFSAISTGALHGALEFLEALRRPRPAMPKRPRSAPKPNGEYMDEKELCTKLGISSITATKWRAKVEGPPFVKLGRMIRYRRSEVEAWLASNHRGPAPVD